MKTLQNEYAKCNITEHIAPHDNMRKYKERWYDDPDDADEVRPCKQELSDSQFEEFVREEKDAGLANFLSSRELLTKASLQEMSDFIFSHAASSRRRKLFLGGAKTKTFAALQNLRKDNKELFARVASATNPDCIAEPYRGDDPQVAVLFIEFICAAKSLIDSCNHYLANALCRYPAPPDIEALMIAHVKPITFREMDSDTFVQFVDRNLIVRRFICASVPDRVGSPGFIESVFANFARASKMIDFISFLVCEIPEIASVLRHPCTQAHIASKSYHELVQLATLNIPITITIENNSASQFICNCPDETVFLMRHGAHIDPRLIALLLVQTTTGQDAETVCAYARKHGLINAAIVHEDSSCELWKQERVLKNNGGFPLLRAFYHWIDFLFVLSSSEECDWAQYARIHSALISNGANPFIQYEVTPIAILLKQFHKHESTRVRAHDHKRELIAHLLAQVARPPLLTLARAQFAKTSPVSLIDGFTLARIASLYKEDLRA